MINAKKLRGLSDAALLAGMARAIAPRNWTGTVRQGSVERPWTSAGRVLMPKMRILYDALRVEQRRRNAMRCRKQRAAARAAREERDALARAAQRAEFEQWLAKREAERKRRRRGKAPTRSQQVQKKKRRKA